jgi:hypothetical protein
MSAVSAYCDVRNTPQFGAIRRNFVTTSQETTMSSSDNDLNALNSVITVAGALAAILGGIAGVAGLATFLGTGAGS